jgi:hypothetical protein
MSLGSIITFASPTIAASNEIRSALAKLRRAAVTMSVFIPGPYVWPFYQAARRRAEIF